jgi:hypothetical protein
VRPLIHKVDPERIARERKQAALKSGKPVPDSLMTDREMRVDHQESEDEEDKRKKHRHLFDRQ